LLIRIRNDEVEGEEKEQLFRSCEEAFKEKIYVPRNRAQTLYNVFKHVNQNFSSEDQEEEDNEETADDETSSQDDMRSSRGGSMMSSRSVNRLKKYEIKKIIAETSSI